MKNKLALIFPAAVALVGLCFAQTSQVKVAEAEWIGKEAPAFEAKDQTGKAHSLKSLTEKGPVFLVFWKTRCPHNKAASTVINNIAKAYDGKANIVGVLNNNEDASVKWREQFSVPYAFLADPEESIIGSYKLKKSIVTLMVDKDGKVSKVFPGYGEQEMAQLNQAVAESLKVETKEVDLSMAPKNLTYG